MEETETPALEAGEDAIDETQEVSASPEPEEPDEPDTDEAKTETDEQKSKSKLRRERRNAEIERLRQSEAQAIAKAEAAQKRLAEMQAASSSLKPPVQSDYPNYEDFQAALAAHKTLQALDQREIARAEAERQNSQQAFRALESQRQEAFIQTVQMVNEDGRARFADYDAVVNRHDVPITPAMVSVIADTDDPGVVAYHIAKTPELAAKLANLPPVQMAREIGRIEARLASPRTTTSNAPPPITPVNPKAKAATDPSKMSPDEYAAWRAKGGTFKR